MTLTIYGTAAIIQAGLLLTLSTEISNGGILSAIAGGSTFLACVFGLFVARSSSRSKKGQKLKSPSVSHYNYYLFSISDCFVKDMGFILDIWTERRRDFGNVRIGCLRRCSICLLPQRPNRV